MTWNICEVCSHLHHWLRAKYFHKYRTHIISHCIKYFTVLNYGYNNTVQVLSVKTVRADEWCSYPLRCSMGTMRRYYITQAVLKHFPWNPYLWYGYADIIWPAWLQSSPISTLCHPKFTPMLLEDVSSRSGVWCMISGFVSHSSFNPLRTV